MSEVQSTEPETVLQFPLPDVIELVAHSPSCTERIESYSQREAGDPGTPALEWVKDDGGYLMSNGLPCLGRDGEINRVVYAEGWGPAMLSVAQSSAELSPPRPSRFPKSYFYDSVKLTLRVLHGSM